MPGSRPYPTMPSSIEVLLLPYQFSLYPEPMSDPNTQYPDSHLVIRLLEGFLDMFFGYVFWICYVVNQRIKKKTPFIIFKMSKQHRLSCKCIYFENVYKVSSTLMSNYKSIL